MAIGPGFDPSNPDNFTLIGEVATDGTFEIQLFPNTYELYIMGQFNPFIDGVTVNSGQVTNLGTINF